MTKKNYFFYCQSRHSSKPFTIKENEDTCVIHADTYILKFYNKKGNKAAISQKTYEKIKKIILNNKLLELKRTKIGYSFQYKNKIMYTWCNINW